MSHQFANIMFTDEVIAAQERYGSRARNERFAEIAGPNDVLGDREASFIARRDSFYIATVNEDGWPYVQHRGRPPRDFCASLERSIWPMPISAEILNWSALETCRATIACH